MLYRTVVQSNESFNLLTVTSVKSIQWARLQCVFIAGGNKSHSFCARRKPNCLIHVRCLTVRILFRRQRAPTYPIPTNDRARHCHKQSICAAPLSKLSSCIGKYQQCVSSECGCSALQEFWRLREFHVSACLNLFKNITLSGSGSSVLYTKLTV